MGDFSVKKQLGFNVENVIYQHYLQVLHNEKYVKSWCNKSILHL